MLQCKKCNADLSSRSDYTTGYSKKVNPKTGKEFGAWRGIKCTCGNLEFVPFARKQEPKQAPKQQAPADHTSPNTKLELIIKQINDVLVKQKSTKDKIDEIDGKIQSMQLILSQPSINEEALQWARENREVKSPEDIKWEE